MALSDPPIDYTAAVARCYGWLATDRRVRDAVVLLAAHGRDTDVLLLQRLPDLFTRVDGQRARYCLEHRWLTQPCHVSDDEAWACVKGSDFTYWRPSEIPRLLAAWRADRRFNLFDHFQLFP